MQIEEKSAGNIVVRLDGELGHHEAINAMQMICGAIEQQSPRELQIDFARVGFMDSSGIAVVVQASRKLSQLGGSLTVSGASPQAMRVFSAAGIPKIIKFI